MPNSGIEPSQPQMNGQGRRTRAASWPLIPHRRRDTNYIAEEDPEDEDPEDEDPRMSLSITCRNKLLQDNTSRQLSNYPPTMIYQVRRTCHALRSLMPHLTSSLSTNMSKPPPRTNVGTTQKRTLCPKLLGIMMATLGGGIVPRDRFTSNRQHRYIAGMKTKPGVWCLVPGA